MLLLLLFEAVLLELLELCHVLLQSGQLLLVGDGVLLEGGQGGLVLLFQLSLLLDLSTHHCEVIR